MDRVEMYYKVNVAEEEMKVPILIAAMGDEAYELLENLASPTKPAMLTLAQINDLMTQHLQPAPSVLAERYRFRQRRQNVGETVSMYVAELKRLSKHCKFGSKLSEDLRDQFVCGLYSDVIRQQLFAEDDKVTFTAAVKLATSLEAAERDAAIVEQAKATGSRGTGEVQSVMFASRGRSSSTFGGAQTRAPVFTSQRRGANGRQGRHCEACGAHSHNYVNCKFRDYVCSKCQRTGHLRRVCPDWGAGAGAGAAGRGGARAPARRGGTAAAAGPARSAMYYGDADRESSEEHGGDFEEELHHLCLNNYQSGNDCAVLVLVIVAPSGVKLCVPEDQSLSTYHALRRISFATCESASALFAFVAREPRAEPLDEPPAEPAPTHYEAEELNSLVGDAFRMAFASQLQPSAPLWSAELSGGECARAPDSLPGLTHHYPRSRDRSPSKCNIMGMQHEASPTSSEESNSPTEINCYRRLGERAPLMKRLAMGLSGALLQPSDDDSTPLVADTPTTPTNLPLCMNGYVNEASEAEARSRDTRESNRELSPRHDSLHNDLDEFVKCNNIKNGSGSAGCSAATSSSSGASSCGGSHGSGNNNVPRAEPELRHAPWFQAGIPREIALEVLSNQPVGAFMVRCSTTQTGCFALSVRVPRDFQPSGIAHYLILRTPKGYKIKGFTKEFTSLSALVTHHSVMPELLPCPLRLARRAPPPRAPRDPPAPRPAPRHRPLRPQLDV